MPSGAESASFRLDQSDLESGSIDACAVTGRGRPAEARFFAASLRSASFIFNADINKTPIDGELAT